MRQSNVTIEDVGTQTSYTIRFQLPLAATSQIHIGCQSHPIKYWIENYKVYGRTEGLTAGDIEEYGDFLRYIEAISKIKIPAKRAAKKAVKKTKKKGR